MVEIRDPLSRYLMIICTLVIIGIIICMIVVGFMIVDTSLGLIYGDTTNISIPSDIINDDSIWLWTSDNTIYYSRIAVSPGDYSGRKSCSITNRIVNNTVIKSNMCEITDMHKVIYGTRF